MHFSNVTFQGEKKKKTQYFKCSVSELRKVHWFNKKIIPTASQRPINHSLLTTNSQADTKVEQERNAPLSCGWTCCPCWDTNSSSGPRNPLAHLASYSSWHALNRSVGGLAQPSWTCFLTRFLALQGENQFNRRNFSVGFTVSWYLESCIKYVAKLLKVDQFWKAIVILLVPYVIWKEEIHLFCASVLYNSFSRESIDQKELVDLEIIKIIEWNNSAETYSSSKNCGASLCLNIYFGSEDWHVSVVYSKSMRQLIMLAVFYYYYFLLLYYYCRNMLIFI